MWHLKRNNNLIQSKGRRKKEKEEKKKVDDWTEMVEKNIYKAVYE